MTAIQRVKKLIKWLIFSDYGDNENEIATLLGYNKSSLSQILNEKVPLSDKFIEKICKIDQNINKVWIETGDGEMLISNKRSDDRTENNLSPTNTKAMIELQKELTERLKESQKQVTSLIEIIKNK